jgi:insertion element IS1 protein InsB
MRKLRILESDVWYDVHTSVNNREPLFWSAQERARFKQVLNEAREIYVFELRGLQFEGPQVSFCIKPADGFELPVIMQWVKQTFAVRIFFSTASGSGMRAAAGTGIAKDTVASTLGSIEALLWYANYDCLNSRRNGGIAAELVSVNEAETDEMRSFAGDKSRQYWLLRAIGHNTGEPLAFHFGTRRYENLDGLLALLEPFNIKIVYSDNNFAYRPQVTGSEVITGKENTQKTERKHLSLRMRCSRLARKGKRFFKDPVCTKSLPPSLLTFGSFRELFGDQLLLPTTCLSGTFLFEAFRSPLRMSVKSKTIRRGKPQQRCSRPLSQALRSWSVPVTLLIGLPYGIFAEDKTPEVNSRSGFTGRFVRKGLERLRKLVSEATAHSHLRWLGLHRWPSAGAGARKRGVSESPVFCEAKNAPKFYKIFILLNRRLRALSALQMNDFRIVWFVICETAPKRGFWGRWRGYACRFTA